MSETGSRTEKIRKRNLEDSQWIDEVLNGKKQVFEKLVIKYQKLVFSQIYQMVKDPSITEELAQEVFINAYTALKTFILQSSFKSWILKIAYNRTLDYFRKNKMKFDQNFELNLLMIESTTQEDMANKDLLASLLSKINLEAQILLHLKYVLDLNYDELAHLLDDSPGNIKIKIHRIKKSLKGMIREEDRIHGGN